MLATNNSPIRKAAAVTRDIGEATQMGNTLKAKNQSRESVD
jgi:hypothetical protein